MAARPNPYRRYEQTSVTTATPEQLLLMLYDGALRFLGRARAAMQAEDIEGASTNINRTQDIIAELMASLNLDIPVAGNLMAIYSYVQRRLIEANVRKDTGSIDEVHRLLSSLQEAWREAAEQLMGQRTAEAGGLGHI